MNNNRDRKEKGSVCGAIILIFCVLVAILVAVVVKGITGGAIAIILVVYGVAINGMLCAIAEIKDGVDRILMSQANNKSQMKNIKERLDMLDQNDKRISRKINEVRDLVWTEEEETNK